MKEIDGIFSAGETPREALENLRESIALYVEYNKEAPDWLMKGDFTIVTQLESDE